MKSLQQYLNESILYEQSSTIKNWRGDKSLQHDRIEDVVKRYPSIKGQFDVRERDGKIDEIYLHFQSKYANNSSKNSLNSNNEFSPIHYQHYCYDMDEFEMAAYEHEYGSDDASLFNDSNKIKVEFKKTSLVKYKSKGILFTVNPSHQHTPGATNQFFPIKLDEPASFRDNKAILSIPLDYNNTISFEEFKSLNTSKAPDNYLISTLIEHAFTNLADVIGRRQVKSVVVYTPDFNEYIFPSKYVDCYEIGNYLIFAID